MSEPVIPQCAACRVAGSNAHCDACPKTPWQEYASSEDGMREYAKAEPVMPDVRCGKCGYELPDQAPQIDYRPCGYCILLEQCEAQAATIERLREVVLTHPDFPTSCIHEEEPWYCDSCMLFYQAEMQHWHDKRCAALCKQEPSAAKEGE